MYSWLKPFLFSLDPEKAHNLSFKSIKAAYKSGMGESFFGKHRLLDKRLEKEVMGIKFPNPVGLAAGMDKDATLFREFGKMGFGFVEVGTVTPRPQPGNPKPRLFRLVEDRALINRMGFNNHGLEAMKSRLKAPRGSLVVGGNIGKNKDTPNEKALDDYLICFEGLFDYVDYFVVNVSSPNTPNLRELQGKEPLKKILGALQHANSTKKNRKPIMLKIAPDLGEGQLDDIVEIVKETGIDGVIATNTTISREGLKAEQAKLDEIGAGGLSGAPLSDRSTEVIRELAAKSGKSFAIIGVGGIFSAEDAMAKLEAGADLVQIYTGFVYRGPSLIREINQKLLDKCTS